ncbi:FlgK family flagellar hook-associated protein [Sandarakinorhabdus sp.]|uniref:flagellar hook-associated protein FlgK n=1 Tax=Sandarakinorhabdus sp. TaxID=1916663 RepID=UPI00286DEA6B|nr:flagellar basal body protein [Sandarakinorhabdus sp.]
MMDLLALGSAGVRAFQAALAVTGDNVANADTPGYVRRSLILSTPQTGPGGPIDRENFSGAGVRTDSIARAADALKTNAARVASGDHARFAVRSDWLQRLQSLVTNADTGGRVGAFFDAGNDLASAPTSLGARALFLSAADSAAGGFRGLGADMDALSADIAKAAKDTARTINSLTSALARVNSELRRTQSGGTAANGLLDSRDRLLDELSGLVRISVSESIKGAVTVKLGTGAAAALLVPETGSPVQIGFRDAPAGAEIILGPDHDPTPLRLPASGRLSGLIEAARSVTAMRQDNDLLANRFAVAANDWHQGGTDALGDRGATLFSVTTLEVTAGRANAGSAAIDITIDDGAAPFAGGYRLIRGLSDFTLERADGSASITGTGPLVLDGVTVRTSAGAATGDAWALSPRGGAAGLSLRPLGPERLAVAAPYVTDASDANLGSGGLRVVADPAAAGIAAPLPWRVVITAPGLADVLDPVSGAVLATVPADGSLIAGTGFAFAIPAGAVTGDTFRLMQTGAGSSDNGNALALAQRRSNDGPDGTLEESHDAGVARIGSALAETDRLVQAALAVKDDTARAADDVTGVDLEREAAELTRLQVAYRANAQVIATARDLFDTLLGLRQ